MTRFLTRVTQFFLLQMVIGVVVLGSAHLNYRKGYLAALEEKIELAEMEGPPRILFVGGSSVAFGIDSDQFESSQWRPVNLGLHASLGLDFCTTLVESHVRAGDLIVLMPEHSNLLEKMHPQPKLQRSLLRQCPRAARYLNDPWPGPKTFLDQRAIPEFACWVQTGIERLPANIRDSVLAPLGIISGPKLHIYSRASFNHNNGDMVAHHDIANLGKPHRRPLSVANRGKLLDSITRLNRCIDICRDKGASVVFAYPPMPEPQYAVSRDAMHEITETLQTHLRCPIVTQPETSAFALDDIFDSSGHLNMIGKRKHTRTLIDGLTRYETEIASELNAARRYR
jgi:hypothetical protein